MKRFATFSGLAAIGFLLFWALIVVVEVKVQPFWFLKYMFFASLPLVFVSFFVTAWRAFRPAPNAWGIAVVSSIVLSPIFIFLGVVLITNFKFLIGGHI